MRLFADENIDRLLVQRLRERGHTVFAAAERGPGLDDGSVLTEALRNDAILLTEDKGFGELVTLRGQPCKGIVLLRLNELSRHDAIAATADAIERLQQKLEGHLTVIQPGVIRARAIPA